MGLFPPPLDEQEKIRTRKGGTQLIHGRTGLYGVNSTARMEQVLECFLTERQENISQRASPNHIFAMPKIDSEEHSFSMGLFSSHSQDPEERVGTKQQMVSRSVAFSRFMEHKPILTRTLLSLPTLFDLGDLAMDSL